MFNLLVFTILFCSCQTIALADDKIKVEEIIAKHLQAIGEATARAEIKTRTISGEVQLKYLNSGPRIISAPTNKGTVTFLSEKDKILFALKLEDEFYSHEKFLFDSKDVKISTLRGGRHSETGNFLRNYSEILKLGLLGGTISSAFPLEEYEKRGLKLKYEGIKKVDGRDCYVVKAIPKKNSELAIKLFFDTQNFLHVRTSYERVMSTGVEFGPVESSKQLEKRITVVEDFFNYKKESGLTIPRAYRIYFSLGRGTEVPSEMMWVFVFNKFEFNQVLEANAFVLESK